MLGPVIEGERLRLIPATEEMLPTFVKWMSDREVTRFLGRQEPPSLEQEKEWFKGVCGRDNVVFWVIALGDRIIGTSGIHDINWRNRRASTGSLIGEKDEWRKGYASEAHRLRTRYAFEELGLEKLQSSAVIENVGSIRALEKSGYRQYGIARRHEFRGGRWYDMWFGEVLRDEWLEAQANAG